MSLSLVSLNARGLRQNCKRKALFLFAKQLKTDFIYFQESHSISADINFWRSQWGNDIWFSHGSERSAGVTTAKNSFSGDVLHSDCDSLGHYILLVVRFNNTTFITANLYGYNSKSDNDKLLDSLENRIFLWLSKYPDSLLFIGGDFNTTLDDTMDRWPPAQSSSSNTKLKMLMEKFDVNDVWREKFPNDKSFTWSNRTGTRQSRIDFWLVSNSIDRNNVTINILTTPLTDHRAVYINVQLFASDITHGRSSYWKLNNSLLINKLVIKEVNKLVSQFWNKATKEKSYSTNWELFKFEVCKFLRRYGSHIAKSRRIEEEEIISKIASFYQRPPDDISQEDRLNLLDLQSKLDEIYRRKAEGAL